MKRIVLFMLFILATSVSATVPGDRIASYPLPGGYNEEQQISGLAVVKGKIYITNFQTFYIYQGDVNTGTWEKSWLFTEDAVPYGMSVSNSTDTLALVGNETKQLFFLDLNSDDLDILGSVFLDESVVQESVPPYLTGVLYMMYGVNYRVMVVDRDNFKIYEVDPIAMEYKGKTDAPADISLPYWLRGIGFDFDMNCIVWALSCFNEGATQLDSSMVAAYNPYTWTRREDLYQNGHFIPKCAYDPTGQGSWFTGEETYMNIRGIGYVGDYQNEVSKVYPSAGMGNAGYSPQAVYLYASFFYNEENIKQATWGGIKKMYASNVSSIGKPSSGSTKSALKDINANRNIPRRIFIPKRATLK